MVSISMKQMLEAGVHFGHQTKRWNPKMKEYIFGQRNGIYIIDLQKSLRLFRNAVQFAHDLGVQGKSILFLGTKRQDYQGIQQLGERRVLLIWLVIDHPLPVTGVNQPSVIARGGHIHRLVEIGR